MRFPGPIRQIGYVVTDLDQALANWVELGVGPWLVIRGLPMQALYRGEPATHAIACVSNSGELQVELIQQRTTRRASSPSFSRPMAPAITSWPTGQRISTPL